MSTPESNMLSPLNFGLVMERTPNVNYLVQKVQIPGLNLGTADIATPFVRIINPGNLAYGDFQVTFKVGENMTNYMEIFNWMVTLGHPDSLDQFDNIKSDATLFIMNSAKRPQIKIKFTDCIPTALSAINLDTTLPSVQYVDATVSFRFQRFYYDILS